MCKIHQNNSEAKEKTIQQKATQDINQHRDQKINQDVVFKEQNEDVNNLAVNQQIYQQINQHVEQCINENVK